MTDVWGKDKKAKRKFNSKNYFQNVIIYEMQFVCEYKSVNMIPQRYVSHIFYLSGTSFWRLTTTIVVVPHR